MRNSLIVWVVLFLATACTQSSNYRTEKKTDKNGYSYETVLNDPLKARIYTLKNGLKVYLSPNADEPRVTCLVGVRAGSTSDPEETTGLAHYFEHMMFKGTPRMGTTNWEEESKLIAQITDLFEKHRSSSDVAEKKAIYKEIDRLSQEAAKYVATNEYDKLVGSIGAKNTNAGTSYESTVYINDVPVNELEKWAQLESERFRGIVLRLFHTELETVYEEFNMYQDMDSERAFSTLLKGLFPTHPYGRDIIGYPEHIKNPSMINIQKFFETYYVPNNMAICLSGDIDFESTIQIIDKYFGNLESKELPERKRPVEEPFQQVVSKDVVGPEPENITLAWRVNGIGTEDRAYVQLIDMILSNSQAGLIDLDLVQKQKVLYAQSFQYMLTDYGMHIMQGGPLKGQSLDEVKNLLLEQIEKVKKGEFDDWLIPAVINDLKLSKIRQQERNMGRAYEMMNDYINAQSREEALKYMKKLEKITKEQLVQFANKTYGDNYVVVYKRQGENVQLVKVEKPEITDVPINRDLQSDFAKEFQSVKSPDVSPVFVDFNQKIKTEPLQEGCDFHYLKNESNELFSLRYIIDMGSWHSREFELAVGYLKFIGTQKYGAADFQKELYKSGLELNVSTSEERSVITVRGLGSSFNKGLELLEELLATAKADPQAYADYVARILKDRADQKAQQDVILWEAMWKYGQYGTDNPKKFLLSEAELKAIDPENLTRLIHEISTYKHRVFYYGPDEMATVKMAVANGHKMPLQLADIPAAKTFYQTKATKSRVYVVDYDINQANILMVATADTFSKELVPITRIYNEFYGGGLSSVVFQEIRESKALAYSAYAGYRLATNAGRPNSLLGYLGTQADKLPIATSTLMQLLTTMPKATEQYNMARESIVKKINSERITKEQIFWTWQQNLDRGIDYDIRKDEYDAAKTVNIDEFEKFFNQHIKGQNYQFMVLGKKANLDMKALKTLGEVEELSLEELFGF